MSMQPGDQGAGIVTVWFDRASHGYGFVEVPGEARELYVSSRDLIGIDDLKAGQRVRLTFDRALNGQARGVKVHRTRN